MFRLPQWLRPALQQPLGELVVEIPDWFKKNRPPVLITVGDVVTARFLGAALSPDIGVVDHRVMRSGSGPDIRKTIDGWRVKEVRVKNPPGTITLDLMRAFEIPDRPIKIVVEGEEDLAVIPAVQTAPEGSVVVYGQPHRGMVVIRVTSEVKRRFSKFLQQFERINETNP
jgi:hypothetical protein